MMGERQMHGQETQSLWWEALSWLYHEAELLDEGRFDEWLDLLSDDIAYEAPIRLTTELGKGDGTSFGTHHFLEDRHTLELRVKRLKTEYAWAEDPPSRTRRFVSNVRVKSDESQDEIGVRSYLLLYRNRGNDSHADLISAERQDILRRSADGWRLRKRLILIDQSVLGTKNLGVFL
jgi:3-phenylpropionate/cinnamic acid dioxygenase small subunit